MNVKELKEKLSGFDDEDEVVLEENHSDLSCGILDFRKYHIKRAFIGYSDEDKKQLVLSRDNAIGFLGE